MRKNFFQQEILRTYVRMYIFQLGKRKAGTLWRVEWNTHMHIPLKTKSGLEMENSRMESCCISFRLYCMSNNSLAHCNSMPLRKLSH